VAVVVALLAGIVVANPRARFDSFKEPPSAVSFERNGFVRQHILSGGGSGRWQFWSEAIDEWRAHPLLGGGAGSFESWWAEHTPISYFIRDAHSFYLESLGELGPIGFVLATGLIGTGLVVGARRSRTEGAASVAAAATAALAGFAIGCATDWMWELTVVSVCGMAFLGIVVGPATARAPVAAADEVVVRPRPGPFAVGAIAVAWLLVCVNVLPLISETKLDDSRSAVRRGERAAALGDARTARSVTPWAASPYLQLALVNEAAGNLRDARRNIRRAIDHDGSNWQLWLTAARIDTKAGQIEEARAALHRAQRLNPRSPLIRGLSS
jgi:hypothetical protein